VGCEAQARREQIQSQGNSASSLLSFPGEKGEKMNNLLRFPVDNNDVTFTDEVKSDSESLVKKARLFYVGTHKGRDYSAAALKKVADSFEEVPLQLDHSKSARDTVGIVRKTWLEQDGKELHGELEFLGRDPVEKVRLGLWTKLSVGMTIKQPEMKLMEVSVTPFPALAAAQVFSENNDSKGVEAMDPKTKETTVTAAAAEETVKMADYEAMKVEFAAAQARLATMEAEKAEAVQKLRFAEDKEFIEAFCQGPHIKTTPAMKEAELKLYNSLDEEQRALFAAVKKAQPALIDTTIYGTQKASKPGEDFDEERVKRL